MNDLRWLSKKYGKIVMPVIEEHSIKIPSASGIPGEFDELVKPFYLLSLIRREGEMLTR